MACGLNSLKDLGQKKKQSMIHKLNYLHVPTYNILLVYSGLRDMVSG